MASTFTGLASIPRCLTMKPRSNPDGTPKTHFLGLSLHWYAHKLAKVSERSAMKSSFVLVLTTTSLT